MRIRLALSLALTLLTLACGSSSPSSSGGREYTLQGQIIAMSADHREATIKHEEIPGFMSAMTMSYKVRDAKEYASLVPGDLVNATLVVEDADAYLKNVKKVGDAPLERPSGSTALPGGLELLATGAPVPDIALTNQDGDKINLGTFHDSALIVTFTYTHCPMPTFCPLMDKNFAAIQEKLAARNNDLKAHLLSVTIDPTIDTPPVLKAHAKTLGADPKIWTWATTGDRDAIDKWAARFGVSISRAANDPTDITHNLRTLIIDRQGNLVRSYSGNEWTPDQVLADVRVMVGID
ncbi:MAG: SCO family protein [Acidobacteriaceae bacterium]|jgi:protein SCO1/2|nr:SCO family protein [Acidobacteriaceae bacterium]